MHDDGDKPGNGYARGWVVRVLSTLLERRTVEQAVQEARLSEWDAILQQKRGCRRGWAR